MYNRFKPIFVCFLLIFCCFGYDMHAQNKNALRDTFENQVALLAQLSQAGNFEQAAEEAENLRAFLRRSRMPLTPRALGVLSGIYKANQDERSATRMLAEAELDARRDPNPETRVPLLTTLVRECRAWEMPDLALTCQQLLSVAQDSLDNRTRRAETTLMKSRYDSLLELRERELLGRSMYFHVDKEQAYLWGGLLALLFFILLIAYLKNNDRWRKQLHKRELEWDLLRANLQREARESAAALFEVARAEQENAKPDPYTIYQGPKPEQVALLIEPNRQVVLYLKSLLSDRFQLETASTAMEGLQMATEMMPDLIVCDTILDNKNGIDIARQLKLSERTNHVPVVLLTDRFGNDGRLDALRAGAEAWFTRPVIDDEFDATIQKLLDAKKVKHEQFQRFMHLYFGPSRVSLNDPFLDQTVRLIEQHLSEPDFLPDDLAKKLQLSKAHFTRKLKALTGKEPTLLLREMRLEKAKVLLEKRAGTPQAIAELVGFSSSGTFALAFKEYFGENTLLLYTPPARLNG